MLAGKLIPAEIKQYYEVHEWRNAGAVLVAAHSAEWRDIQEVLSRFRLLKSDILAPGGGKSPIAKKFDVYFQELGWQEKGFDTKIIVDDEIHETPTHKVDCCKNKIALEVEWNNKDPFYDRDLNNFRLLFDLRAIDAGIILTRCDELQTLFNTLGKGASYGPSTTHMSKLLPRIEGGGGGGCPILVLGMKDTLYVED